MGIEWVRTGEGDQQGIEATERLTRSLEQFNTDSKNPNFQLELANNVSILHNLLNNRTKYTEDVLEKGLGAVSGARQVISKAMQDGVWNPGV
jgi:hypothetical protein